MATIRRLYKQGNSIVVSVPTWMLENAGLELGDDVMMEVMEMGGPIQFRKWNPPKKEELTEGQLKTRKFLEG